MAKLYYRYFGRKCNKLLFATVFGFWLIIAALYFRVHHAEQQSTSDRVLNRDTRKRIRSGQDRMEIKPDKDEKAAFNESSGDFIFPLCDDGVEILFFDPTILKNGEVLRQFTGRKLIPYVSVYPSDNTATLDRRKKDGNTVISRKVVDKVLENFKEATKYGSRFQTSEIVTMERLTMIGGLSFGGRLFLIELNKPHHVSIASQNDRVNEDSESTIYHSEYVIESGQRGSLCHPKDYVINSDRKVHVIITVKNLSKWVLKLIREFEELQKESGDRNFKMLFVDFNSTDANLVGKINSTIIRGKVKLLQMDDTYNKGVGVKAAVGRVQDPDDIVFICDLYLEIPATLLSDIRKHVIRNKMVFAPVVGKLEKGAPPEHPKGEWDTNGFGIIAMTKADWDMIGGIDTNISKGDQWGGEDWGMIDRIVGSGLLVNRRRVPGLFQHYHDKADMWPGGRNQIVGVLPGHEGDMKYKAQPDDTIDAERRRVEMLRMDLERNGIKEVHFGGPRGERIHAFINKTFEKGSDRGSIPPFHVDNKNFRNSL